MHTPFIARRRRMVTALLQSTRFVQAGVAAIALTGVAHGSPTSAERPPTASEASDDGHAGHGATRVDAADVPAPASIMASATAQTDRSADAASAAPDSAATLVESVSPLPNALLVSTELLEQMRGGYERNDGANTLRVTFGVERAVYVNGALVSTSSLALDGLGRLGGSGTISPGSPVNAPGLSAESLRFGAGNTLSLSPTELPTGALVLQNSLNDQRLEARTVVNAVVEGAHLMRAARLESIMRDSSTGAVRR